MIGASCDCGTAGCDPVQYRISYDSVWGWTVWPQASSDTGTTQSLTPLTGDNVCVSSTGPGRSRASRDADVEPVEFERPARPIGLRTRVRAPVARALPPKQAARATAVAWMRGRVPRGASDRVLRCWGVDRRR